MLAQGRFVAPHPADLRGKQLPALLGSSDHRGRKAQEGQFNFPYFVEVQIFEHVRIKKVSLTPDHRGGRSLTLALRGAVERRLPSSCLTLFRYFFERSQNFYYEV